jgi:hypothetical protein
MRFRTEVFPKQPPFTLSIGQPIVSVGSCFAQAMGDRLLAYKIRVENNPYGTLFNPHSIGTLLHSALNQSPLPPNLSLEFQERWLSYLTHSQINASTKAELEEKLAGIHNKVKTTISEAQALIITLGSAWVYQLIESEQVVANCHKQPQNQFSKRLLSVQEITDSFTTWYSLAKKSNPELNLILTVSPVRHEKDGLEENSLSKAILRQAVYEIVSTSPKNFYYFPSYEIMLDDLRDYRFYKSDLLHPTTDAEEYIWEKFIETLLDSEAQKFVSDWKGIRLALNHRPFNPKSEAHQQFIRSTIAKLAQRSWPVSVTEEIEQLKEQLIHE